MPKLKCNTLLIAVATAMLSTSAALADTKPDDRSYLPPQAKEPVEHAAPQSNRGLRSAHNRTPQQHAHSRYVHPRERRHYAQYRTRRHYAHWNARRYYASPGLFPGIFSGFFR
jgi:hypothetical protein